MPPAFASGGALRYVNTLVLAGTSLSGTLPAQWAQSAGLTASLEELDLSNSLVSGSLPPAWSGSTWRNINSVNLHAANFSG